jgi:hypothetical protein
MIKLCNFALVQQNQLGENVCQKQVLRKYFTKLNSLYLQTQSALILSLSLLLIFVKSLGEVCGKFLPLLVGNLSN